MKVVQNFLLTILLSISIGTAIAQKGPPGGYGDYEYEANAIWQPSAQASMARSVAATAEPVRIKTCVGFRKWTRFAPFNTRGQRVFLVETNENGQIVRWLSEAAYEQPKYPARKKAAPRPYWCFFSDRDRPPTAVAIAEGSSRTDATVVLYDSQSWRLEYKEQPPTADLNRIMTNWVRGRN
jgi:hypothetical protein